MKVETVFIRSRVKTVVESEGKSERVECDDNGSCDWGCLLDLRDRDGAKGRQGSRSWYCRGVPIEEAAPAKCNVATMRGQMTKYGE
jgi:hypothetical protein